MIDVNLATLIVFLISLVISAIIIYFVTKIFGEKEEGFGTAILAAFIGAIIYAVAYYFLSSELGWLASLI